MRLYNELEGIALDMEKIEKNLGRKVTAKLILNSFWGKFGEQVNKLQLQKYTKAYQLLDVVHNKIAEISDIWFLNSEGKPVNSPTDQLADANSRTYKIE